MSKRTIIFDLDGVLVDTKKNHYIALNEALKKFGIKKTIPHILGTTLGFTSLVLLLTIGLINVFKLFPIIQIVIRYLGTVFLIYLASLYYIFLFMLFL